MFAIVIPVGGKGSRVSKLTNGNSKTEIEILKNKKIIDFQIEQVSKLNKKIIILSNAKFKLLNNYLTKRYNNLNIDIIEENKQLGTAGCLAILKKYKYKFFLVVNGDLIFNINIYKLFKFHIEKKSECTLVVHPNNHPNDSDCLELKDNFQIKKFYFKPHKNKNIPNLCLAGINILNKKVLNFITKDKFQDFSKNFLKKNLKKINFFGYNTREYIKDAGTPKRINQVKKDIFTIKYIKGNLNKKIPAIFLDKDGVINKLDKKKHYQKINILSGVIRAIKIINKSGYLSILITNQPAIAKGVISESKFQMDIKKLSYYLSKNNCYLDRIYFCPHHPEKGFKGEVKKYKIKCNCRKPNNGLLLKAIDDLNIDKKNSYMIGDQFTDYLASKKTNIKFIGVNNNLLRKKNIGLYKNNFLKAVKYILN